MPTDTEWSKNSSGEHPLLGPAARAFEQACRVSIHKEQISALADKLAWQQLDKSHWLNCAPDAVRSFLTACALPEKIRFLTVFHTIGFSYWQPPLSGQERFRRACGGTTYDGATALLVALSQAPQLLDEKLLSTISGDQLARLLDGSGSLRLLTERAALLNDLGRLLQSQPDFVEEQMSCTDFSLAQRLSLLPGFLDQAEIYGERLPFLKRAQLLAADLQTVSESKGHAGTAGAEHDTKGNTKFALTALADYKLPQLLREFGVISYSPALAALIERGEQLAGGSEEEVEIRLATVLTVELIREAWPKPDEKPSSTTIDGLLWQSAQTLDKSKCRPYHLCHTIFY